MIVLFKVILNIPLTRKLRQLLLFKATEHFSFFSYHIGTIFFAYTGTGFLFKQNLIQLKMKPVIFRSKKEALRKLSDKIMQHGARQDAAV